jgi:SAM-dependent methyltransferase
MSTSNQHPPDRLAQNVAAPLHSALVVNRRCQRLANALRQLIPGDDAITGLDIGCGTGDIARAIELMRPQTKFEGVDVVVRPDARVAVTKYDGIRLPFADKSFDFGILVDVLHHTEDPAFVLKEAVRVCRGFILIKDHYCENESDRAILRFMDWVGNKAHGIALPYNYQSRADWQEIFSKCGLEQQQTIEKLELYPFPFSLLFERQLHFATRLVRR